MSPFQFDPFSSYEFAKSQRPDEKYGIASAFLGAAEHHQAAEAKPFPPFDIRLGSAKRLVAYWTTVAQRIRVEGSGILVHMTNEGALRDTATVAMLHYLFTTPPSAKRYRELVKPIQTQLLKAEAADRRLIRRLALETFWGKSVLKCLPETWRAQVLERSMALWRQAIDAYVVGEKSFTKTIRVAPDADMIEIGAVCQLLSRLYRLDNILGLESFLSLIRGGKSESPIGIPFLAYALEHASQTWRDPATVRADIMQREKALHQELARRIQALTAYFICFLEDGANPDHLLWRMSSFWPEDMFNDYREAQRYLDEGGE